MTVPPRPTVPSAPTSAPAAARPTAPAAIASRYQYDEQTGRYRAAGGRFVRETAVRAALDHVLAGADNRARALGTQLRERRISVATWEFQMRREIKRAQIQGYAAAVGGRAQLSPADFGRIGAETRRQYAYLRRFRAQIEAGAYPLDGRFLRRVELYTEAGRAIYHAAEVRAKLRLGFVEYRNELHAADSCTGPIGCTTQTAAGWVETGTLVPIGARACGPRCKCSFTYRKAQQADGGGD